MTRRGTAFSLLFGALAGWGCGAGKPPGKPDLPQSVSPGWTLKSYEHADVPAGVPARVKPECWRAEYAGPGSATVWACGYAEGSSAFDAMQRAESEANTVKFQQDRFLVMVKWNGGSRAEVTALVRGVQKSLKTP